MLSFEFEWLWFFVKTEENGCWSHFQICICWLTLLVWVPEQMRWHPWISNCLPYSNWIKCSNQPTRIFRSCQELRDPCFSSFRHSELWQNNQRAIFRNFRRNFWSVFTALQAESLGFGESLHEGIWTIWLSPCLVLQLEKDSQVHWTCKSWFATNPQNILKGFSWNCT